MRRTRAAMLGLTPLLWVLACGPGLVGSEDSERAPAAKADNDSDDDKRFAATTVLADHNKLEQVADTPHKAIAKVLLLGGTEGIVPLQVQLMKTLPDVHYYVVPAGRNKVSEQTYLDAMVAAGVSSEDLKVSFVKDYTKPSTDWTQDRLMRFRDKTSKRAVLLPVRTLGIGMNEWAAFELGIPRYLEAQFPDVFERFEHEQYYAEWVVDNVKGELYPYSSYYSSWYRGSSWKLSFGDGGDRFTTESTMFVGAPTYDKMLSTLEKEVKLNGSTTSYPQLMSKLFGGRRVISVGDADLAKQYLFHVDMFLTAFDTPDGKTTVILGSPELALNELFGVSTLDQLPDWCNKDKVLWNKRVSSYNQIKADLSGRSYLRVVEIPILFLDLSVGSTSFKPIVTFNNGLLTNRNGKETFVTVSYHFDHPEVDAMIAKAKAEVVKTLSSVGLQTVFLPGGENSVKNAGELRCTAGVIELEEPSAQPPPVEEDLFFEDFEKYRYWARSGLWHRSQDGTCADPGQSSGRVAYYFGNKDTCTYETDPRERVSGTLTSPPIQGISATSALSFAYYRKVEKSSSKAYDVTTVEVAESGTSEWQVVWSRDSRDVSEARWLTTEPIGLGAFAGKTIRVRFAFDSMDAYLNRYTGWLIDDVRVTP